MIYYLPFCHAVFFECSLDKSIHQQIKEGLPVPTECILGSMIALQETNMQTEKSKTKKNKTIQKKKAYPKISLNCTFFFLHFFLKSS